MQIRVPLNTVYEKKSLLLALVNHMSDFLRGGEVNTDAKVRAVSTIAGTTIPGDIVFPDQSAFNEAKCAMGYAWINMEDPDASYFLYERLARRSEELIGTTA